MGSLMYVLFYYTRNLRNSDDRQKRMPAYDRGWIVVKVVSPSTIAIMHSDDQSRKKTVNVDLLKMDVPADLKADETEEVPPTLASNDKDEEITIELMPQRQAHTKRPVAYNLRERAALQCPPRFR